MLVLRLSSIFNGPVKVVMLKSYLHLFTLNNQSSSDGSECICVLYPSYSLINPVGQIRLEEEEEEKEEKKSFNYQCFKGIFYCIIITKCYT